MKIIGIFILILLFAACEKDQIGRYDLERHLYFTDVTGKDSTVLSFSHYPGATQLEMPVEVNLMGDMLTEGKMYQLVVNKELTTATPDLYSVNLTPVFGKELTKDMFAVELKNPDNALKDREVRLVLEIVDNENFKMGFNDRRQIRIYFNDMASKPAWWNATVEIYLGTWTEEKFREFINCTHVTDLTGVEETQIRLYALQFKDYIEENGLDIEIPVY